MEAIIKPFNAKRLVTENLRRTEDITVSEIKQMESFKAMTDEQAEGLITVIKEFTGVVFDVMAKDKTDAPVITMQTGQIKNLAA